MFSSTKALTSAAAWLLIESGDLRVDERVVDIVPEFGTNGKDAVTVEQLFLHSAGFPSAPFRPTDWFDRDRRLARFASWRLNWQPGSRFEYHPTSSMWVIAEIIERRSRRDFDAFVREEVTAPLGLPDFHLGLPAEENHRVATLAHYGEPLTSEDYARLGIPEPPITEVTEDAILAFNTPEVRAVPTPGGGGIATAADLALFYQALLHGRSNGRRRVWKQETLVNATEVRSGDLRDPLSGKRVNRALGVVVAGDEDRNFRGFGHENRPPRLRPRRRRRPNRMGGPTDRNLHRLLHQRLRPQPTPPRPANGEHLEQGRPSCCVGWEIVWCRPLLWRFGDEEVSRTIERKRMHRLKDFKNFEEAGLDLFEPLTILLGRNGSGKTNLIEGVELMAALAHGVPVNESDRHRSWRSTRGAGWPAFVRTFRGGQLCASTGPRRRQV